MSEGAWNAKDLYAIASYSSSSTNLRGILGGIVDGDVTAWEAAARENSITAGDRRSLVGDRY